MLGHLSRGDAAHVPFVFVLLRELRAAACTRTYRYFFLLLPQVL